VGHCSVSGGRKSFGMWVPREIYSGPMNKYIPGDPGLFAQGEPDEMGTVAMRIIGRGFLTEGTISMSSWTRRIPYLFYHSRGIGLFRVLR
jgi:hypothetical protein